MQSAHLRRRLLLRLLLLRRRGQVFKVEVVVVAAAAAQEDGRGQDDCQGRVDGILGVLLGHALRMCGARGGSARSAARPHIQDGTQAPPPTTGAPDNIAEIPAFLAWGA